MLFLMSRYLRTRVADFSHKNQFLYFFYWWGENEIVLLWVLQSIFLESWDELQNENVRERKRNHCNWLVIIFTRGGILEAAEHGLFWLKLPG